MLRAASPGLRRAFSCFPAVAEPLPGDGLVLGCGSNVVDLFFRVKSMPRPGDKGYFADPKVLSGSVVGGVTLNHLAWARLLGAPTGLLASQGDDVHGRAIRSKLRELDVSTAAIDVRAENTTSVSHVLVDSTGERAILMAPASTSALDAGAMELLFRGAADGASMLTSEVSQLPLSGVAWMLKRARKLGIPSCLDVDVPVSVATREAGLGSIQELAEVVQLPTVLKLSSISAESLFRLVGDGDTLVRGSLEAAATQIAAAAGVSVCVVTDGSKGAAIGLGDGRTSAFVPVFKGVHQLDATGAGDAFFGGMVAWIHAEGVPTTAAGAKAMGRVASAAGAACCEVMGALPVLGQSEARMLELEPRTAALLDRRPVPAHAAHKHAGDDAADGGVARAVAGSTQADVATAGLVSKSLCAPEQSAAVAAMVSAVAACAVEGSGSSAAQVIVTGIGKSAAVAGRLSASLRSVGLRACFLHGTEWLHGDVGMLGQGDVVVAFSHSGETAELVALAGLVKSRGAAYWGVVGAQQSSMHGVCDGVVSAPATEELLGAVPSRSIVAQEMVANAVVGGVVEALGVTKEAFRANHPGGAIGHSDRV
ncbi:hypothetical protein FNF27_02722 [Cafeteria roenbergensis]|uniref:SIS domain-containing protein n=1 Tax=Cafeteria roenbergensis TaxID=33653 RepID=A0A5A8EIB1_CAFRO|nr:hypothetical protein FNF27_02722 [Cafeteria roenbergensis]